MSDGRDGAAEDNAAEDGAAEDESTPAALERPQGALGWLKAYPSVPVGVVAAAMALFALGSWPWEVHAVVETGVAWFALGQAALAMLALPRPGVRIRSLVALALALGGFAFWIIAPSALGPLPVWAYLVTAAGHLAVGFLVPQQDYSRGVRPVVITLTGIVFFTGIMAYSRITGG